MNELHNNNIERAILSSIIFEPGTFDDLKTRINAKDFYHPFHKKIFDTMLELDQEEKPLDDEFIARKMKTAGTFDETAMLDLMSANPLSNATAYIAELKALANKRALTSVATDIKKAVLEDDLAPEKVIELITGKLEAVQNNAPTTTATIKDFLDVYTTQKYLAEPKLLTPIPGTSGFFYDGGLHLVHGLSKSGKTHFVLEIMNQATTHQVIWLDGDNNDTSMPGKFKNIVHIPPLEPNAWLNRLIASKVSLVKWVVILDSLKDFTNGENLDSNEGSNNIMQHIKQLDRLGATVIIVAHSTPGGTTDKPLPPKLKGNSEYIYANVDLTYRFERNFSTNTRTLTAERSRINEVRSDTNFQSTNNQEWTYELTTADINASSKGGENETRNRQLT